MVDSTVVVWVMDLAFWIWRFGLWSDELRRFCGSRFMALSSWVWVHGFAFVVHRRDRRGSSSWLAWIVNLISLIGVGHRLDRHRSLIVVVVVGIVVASGRRWVWLLGWDNETEKERETMRPEREDEKNKNKKGIKNYKEIIFKWSCKKNRSFDVWYIVKWGIKIEKVVFWNCKC